jgi:hypothetical protein
MLASIDALSGGSTGPSPEMSRGPFRRLVEQLRRRQPLGPVLAAAVPAAACQQARRERQDDDRRQEAAKRARHGRGIACPAMCGRPDGM